MWFLKNAIDRVQVAFLLWQLRRRRAAVYVRSTRTY
jgi:hypothetical protein